MGMQTVSRHWNVAFDKTHDPESFYRHAFAACNGSATTGFARIPDFPVIITPLLEESTVSFFPLCGYNNAINHPPVITINRSNKNHQTWDGLSLTKLRFARHLGHVGTPGRWRRRLSHCGMDGVNDALFGDSMGWFLMWFLSCDFMNNGVG